MPTTLTDPAVARAYRLHRADWHRWLACHLTAAMGTTPVATIIKRADIRRERGAAIEAAFALTLRAVRAPGVAVGFG